MNEAELIRHEREAGICHGSGGAERPMGQLRDVTPLMEARNNIAEIAERMTMMKKEIAKFSARLNGDQPEGEAIDGNAKQQQRCGEVGALKDTIDHLGYCFAELESEFKALIGSI